MLSQKNSRLRFVIVICLWRSINWKQFLRDEFITLQILSKTKVLLIQKSDKENSLVIVGRHDYIKKMNKYPKRSKQLYLQINV